jgi:thiol-disulfide isomerase/thioredoxin
VSLSHDAGKIIVLNFWASWCGPCVQEAPELTTFAWRERTHNVIVVGVDFQDNTASARSFQRLYGSNYPTIVDPNGAIANSFGVTAPPTTFIINTSGRVVASLVGATTARQLAAVVARVSS